MLAAGLSLVTALVRPSEASTAVPDGAALFHVKGCATCHEGPGTDTMMGIGPSLAHTPDWASTRVEGMSAPDYLAQSMQQPSAFISPAWAGAEGPTTGMPQLQLSDEDGGSARALPARSPVGHEHGRQHQRERGGRLHRR